jgi:hypothetical protein
MSTPVEGSTGAAGSSRCKRTSLRRCALAASVLGDLDLQPADDGIVLVGVPNIPVSDAELAHALRDAEPDSEQARRRLTRWLHARRAIADRSLDELAEKLRPVGLPAGHELHDGPEWVRQPVLGGCLDVGVGFVGLDPADPDRVVVMPDSVLVAAGIDVTPWWRNALDYLENMGALAISRWRRDPTGPLRPMGDCDVVTLLASQLFRGALCADAGGMRAIAAPVRHRGWLELSRIDPAFVQAAAAVAGPVERGFPRPVLLTVDEVVVALPGGHPARIVLRDAAVEQPHWRRDVLYR